MKIVISTNFAYCTLFCFQCFFIINVVIGAYFVYYKYMNRNKKMFLNIMIMFVIHNIKWEK